MSAIAVLSDPVRRALFEAVAREALASTREEAAATVGISRKLAGFHLDKLVDAGLLALDGHGDVALPRPGRVGRRPKRYQRADADIQVSIPPRRTTLLAELLLHAVSGARADEDPVAAALRVSREHGQVVGERERPPRARGMGAERALALVRAVVDRLGYEPTQTGTGPVQFRTCPFHPMASAAPEVVCGMHHAYIAGMVEGLDLRSVEAALVPASAGCCVELRACAR